MASRLALSVLALTLLAGPAHADLTGTVVDPGGQPLDGVRVRLSLAPPGSNPVSSKDFVVTGPDGTFSAPLPVGAAQSVYIGIGKRRYINISGFLDLTQGEAMGTITMEPVETLDNPDYRWVKPFFPKEDQSDFGCNMCHGKQYEDWEDSLMAESATSERVLSYYLGTNLDGEKAGPGYRVDHPDEAGPCANCHAAAAAIHAPSQTVLSEVEGVATEGVFCDVCHKVLDIDVVDAPGVDGSLVHYRPSAWVGLFAFGPYEDAFGMPMRTSYNPLLTESRFCAGCHEWTNEHGTPVLSTFSEWSEMSGADPDALQCQDCHMKKKFGPDYQGEPEPTLGFILDEPMQQNMHGVKRWSDTTFGHDFHGGVEYAKEAAVMTVEVTQDGPELVVSTVVDNVNAGHALPTGMPFRHMILVVEATGADGEPMFQTGGGAVPDYGGEGDSPADLAGLPGRGYARVLGDGSGTRNVPFWDAKEVIEDTRIRAAEVDTRSFRFAVAAAGGEATVSVRLIYRRAFRFLDQIKGWDQEDQVIAEATEAMVCEPPEEPITPDTIDGPGDVGADDTEAPGDGEAPDDGGGDTPDDGGAADPADDDTAGSGWGCGQPGSAPGVLGLLLALLVFAFAARRRQGC